ncbi:hypothetical protein PG987_002024 [Apiospora arundinis]
MSRIGPRELRALGIQVDANGRPTPQAQLQHGVIAQLPPAQAPLPGPPVLGQPAPAVFGQPAGQPAPAVQPQPVPVFGQPAAAAPGASIFGGPPAAGAGAVPLPAGPPAAGLQPPGQPLAGPLPGMGLVQAAINRQPIVWRIPPRDVGGNHEVLGCSKLAPGRACRASDFSFEAFLDSGTGADIPETVGGRGQSHRPHRAISPLVGGGGWNLSVSDG